MEEENTSAEHSQSPPLPQDVVLTSLPSPALFEVRGLCKAAHEHALLTLARRPFYVSQKAAPSSLCFLLPLDAPSTPLPCSFKLGKSSFMLTFASRNLICLRRQYPSMLDICVCNIFCKWKVTVPPIVHPSLAPLLIRRSFCEDSHVDPLTDPFTVVGFHAMPMNKAHAHRDFSPGFRIFVGNSTGLRVFDSSLGQWSAPVYFPSYLSDQLPSGRIPRVDFSVTPSYPEYFATSDGNLILTMPDKEQTLFKYADKSFHAMGHSLHPSFVLAGYPASAHMSANFNLQIRLAHVEGNSRSNPERDLVLEGWCNGSDHSIPCDTVVLNPNHGLVHGRRSHKHTYKRHLLGSYCHAYQDKVHALVMESEEIQCSYEQAQYRWPHQWHDIPPGDVEKFLHPDGDPNFDCLQNFPARTSRKLMLYSACVDTTNWTMQVFKEANATAFLDLLGGKDDKLGKFLFIGD